MCELGCNVVCGAASSLCGALAELCGLVCNVGCLQLIGPLCEQPPPPPPGGGGGGCPFVYVWNGTLYVVDNNLLRNSMMYESDVEDYYRLEHSLVRRTGKYHLIIGEFQTERSYIDEVKLIAVDHEPEVNIAISPEGKILTYKNPFPPLSAVDQSRHCWLAAINSADGRFYEGSEGSYLLLNFGEVNLTNGARLVLRADIPYKLAESVYVQMRQQSNEWITVARLAPRVYWATEIIDLSDFASLNEELQIRLYFTAQHKIDYVGLDLNPQEDFEIRHANLVSALHFDEGDVKAKLKNSDSIYTELIPGQFIKLEFTFPQNTKKARTLILYIKGRYNTITMVSP